MLSEKAIEARREYKKMWARNNPEKIKAQQERYWLKRAAQQAHEKQEVQPAPLKKPHWIERAEQIATETQRAQAAQQVEAEQV